MPFILRPLIVRLRSFRREMFPKKDDPTCVHAGPNNPGPCATCTTKRSSATRYRLKVIIGLIVAFWLQALDLTIISPILLDIADTFNAATEFSWVISAFTLVSATFIPAWGQLSSILGRHIPLQLSLILVIIGSILCTAAPTSAFGLLLFGRALQGLGCSGISVLVRVIIADKVSLKENAVTWSWFSIAAGVAYAVGPQVGGRLASVSWRWCFAISIPVAVVSMVLLFFVLSPELLGPQPGTPRDSELPSSIPSSNLSVWARLREVDVGGQLLFISGLGLLVLALTWAGSRYAWTSAAVLVPLVIGPVLLIVWILWERSMAPTRFLGKHQLLVHQQPMIPWAILSDRNILVVVLSGFVYSMSTYAILYFCPIYLGVVLGQSTSKASNALLFFLPGLGVGAYLSIFLCNKWPRMTIVPIISGAIIEMVGIGMLAWALNAERLSVIYGTIALTSCGGALRIMASSLHGIGMFRNAIPVVVSLQLLSSPLGGTVAVTIMSTVFTNSASLSSATYTTSLTTGLSSALSSASPAEALALIARCKTGLVLAVVSILPFTVVCVLATLTLGNVTLPKSSESAEEQMKNHVIREPYLWALWKGRGVEAMDIELVSRDGEIGRSDGVLIQDR